MAKKTNPPAAEPTVQEDRNPASEHRRKEAVLPDRVDVVVVGSGPGGYVCAIRAAQLGLSVAIVEKEPHLGGTCLNVGCIPSKALLESSERLVMAHNHLANHGVVVDRVLLDLQAMMRRKSDVVDKLTRGVAGLMKKNRIVVMKGQGHLMSPTEVDVTLTDQLDTVHRVHADRAVVIASGSTPAMPPGLSVPIDDDDGAIVTSTGALSFAQVPPRLLVIGAGVIGLELGSVWQRLGSQVVVVEYADAVLPHLDPESGKQLQRLLGKQGMDFQLGKKVTGMRVGQSKTAKVSVQIEPSAGGETETLAVDRVLVAVGRKPFTDGLGLEELGVVCDDRGAVIVDDATGQTSVPGVYAVGDVTGGLMLAHEASDEGVRTAESIAGHVGFINRSVIPSVVYTFPEIATVGLSERELRDQSVAYKVGRFPFAANARAIALDATDGFVKVFSAKDDDRLLGAVVVGPYAGTIIAEIALTLEFGGSAEDVARTCHGHPTLVEAVREAAHAAWLGHAINI